MKQFTRTQCVYFKYSYNIRIKPELVVTFLATQPRHVYLYHFFLLVLKVKGIHDPRAMVL